MKKTNVGKIMLVIAIITTVFCISNIIYASESVDDLIQDIQRIPGNDINTTTTTQDTGNLTAGGTTTGNLTSKNTTASNLIPANTTNTNKTLPQTGVNDTVMWVLIAVSTVAAIYTYKKLRDYNA